MSEEEERVLTVTDDDGWRCRLERWRSDCLNEWFIGTTVFDAEGNEVMHAGHGKGDMTEETAMERIRFARGLLECGNILQRRKEME